MTGLFELLSTNPGDFRFRLLTGGGDILAESGPYPDKATAVNAITAARECASMALISDKTPHPLGASL